MRTLFELWDAVVIKVVAAIVAPFLLLFVYFLVRKFYRAFEALRFSQAAISAVAREQQDDGRSLEGPGFWLKTPIRRPPNYGDLQGNSIPILMIAATKGGVGKTSLAGSLAAYFASQWAQRRQDRNADRPLRVLVIDQDFQGSFTTMTVHVDHRYAQPCKSNKLVSGELRHGGLAGVAEHISQPGMKSPLSIWTVPAYYDLAQAENRMLIDWLLPLSDQGLLDWLLRLFRLRPGGQSRGGDDIRYMLAESLLDPTVQNSFDLIIIDSPPRLTTSHIQAMCAATHLLVPTILDGLSGDAVARYLDQVATHKLGLPGNSKTAICPHLAPIGVVCTMLPTTNADLSGRINVLTSRITEARLQAELVPEDCFIRQRTPYREHAGERIAYAALSDDKQHKELRQEVDRLGNWLAPKIGATLRGWKQRGQDE